MLLNYLKIAIRNLTRNKVYSLINILGLSLGVACCLLLSLYIEDDISYDKHHARVDDIYRIISIRHTEEGDRKQSNASPPICLTVRDEVPEVEAATRVLNPPGVAQSLIKYEDKLFYETDGFLADSSVFEVLTYDLLQGNPKKALVDPNTVVLSDKLAAKLFGNEPALDKIITISMGEAATQYKITGVFKEQNKSHIHANFFTSMYSAGWGEYVTKDPDAATEWAGQNFVPSYLKLVPGADRKEVVRKMNEVLQKHGAEDMKALGIYKVLDIEPVKDIYLKSDIGRSPRIVYTYVIGSIAIFILLIACINFMNLSTAKAAKRAGEIGIRKAMGAHRAAVIRQILGEAMVIVTISILISVILVQVFLPYFNSITGKSISFDTENMLYFGLALIGITLATGIIAGSYPAFYLSSFEPAKVLKGKFNLAPSGWLRQSLVVFQFVIAIVLVCGMVIISRQLNFMQEKDLGFDAHAKIVLPLRTESARKGYESLKKELEHESSIKTVSATQYIPGSYIWSDMLFYTEGGSMEATVQIQRSRVDHGYLEQMGIKMIAGRSLNDNREMESKEGNVIINRTAANRLGIEVEKLVGQNLYYTWQGVNHSFKVIGIMEDFHQTSPKQEILPTMFMMADAPDQYNFATISVESSGFENSIKAIESNWKKLINDTPFEFSFMDENIQKQYDEDKKVSLIITSFTFIAMLISCLGLYGLSSYMAERRFKEIGVRKVLGASVNQIVGLMSMEFIKLILIAFVIATPLAWYTMDQWLSGFAYRIPIDVTIFMVAGFGALLIALATVSYESLKAASNNPVDSLRSE